MTDIVNADTEKAISFIQMAEEFGIKRLILTKEFKNSKSLGDWKKEFSEIKSNVELVFGVTISPKNVKALENAVNQARNDVEIIIVRGGDYDINRAAVENSKVDVLIHPEEGRTDRGLDAYTCKEARKNGVIVAFSFRRILENYKKSRAFKLSFIAQDIELLDTRNIAIVSDAYSKWEMRNMRNMDDFLSILSQKQINTEQAIGDRIKENMKKMKQIHEGVRRV